jgi:hypothetical protein
LVIVQKRWDARKCSLGRRLEVFLEQVVQKDSCSTRARVIEGMKGNYCNLGRACGALEDWRLLLLCGRKKKFQFSSGSDLYIPKEIKASKFWLAGRSRHIRQVANER